MQATPAVGVCSTPAAMIGSASVPMPGSAHQEWADDFDPAAADEAVLGFGLAEDGSADTPNIAALATSFWFTLGRVAGWPGGRVARPWLRQWSVGGGFFSG